MQVGNTFPQIQPSFPALPNPTRRPPRHPSPRTLAHTCTRSTTHSSTHLPTQPNTHPLTLPQAGVVALLLAAKYEEVWPPEVAQLLRACGGAYTRQQLLGMERVRGGGKQNENQIWKISSKGKTLTG